MHRFASARDRLAVALDVATLEEARVLIERLDGAAGWLKVGAELFTAAGPLAVEEAARSARVFLDTKLHDIPNSVAGAVAAATRSGVSMLTLHTGGGGAMLRAAREAAEDAAAAYGVNRPMLVGVTVLTHFAAADLAEIGIEAEGVDRQVEGLVDLAVQNGLDGIVSSPLEVAALRSRFQRKELVLVTPGIRPEGWPPDDQARTASAGDAISAGADVIVVGRPILRAEDPGQAARQLVGEIERALAANPE